MKILEVEKPESNPLSPRETQVVLFVYHGYSNKEIAKELDLTPLTIKKYRDTAQRKIGAPKGIRAQIYLVRWCAENLAILMPATE